MSQRLVVDTHVVLWTLFNPERLSAAAKLAIELAMADGEPLIVPSISLVEVCYLCEKRRIRVDALSKLTAYLDALGAGMVIAPLNRAVTDHLVLIERDTVPDMPDRIIAATAASLELPLISADSKIQRCGIEVIW